MPSRFPLLLGLLLLALPSGHAVGQHVATARTGESEEGVRIAFDFSWPDALQAALDSAGVSTLEPRAVLAVTGGLLDAAESLEMPRLGIPATSIVETSFDEIRLEAASAAGDSLVADLTLPLVQAGWPGVAGGRNLATLRVRSVTYDPATNVLRRYRRVVVEVRYPPTTRTVSASMLRAANPHLDVTRSVLAEGIVFKIPVRTEGVYQLDATYLDRALDAVGLSLEDIDPASIKIYGNGGKPLPALNRAPRPADLLENPVRVTGSGSDLRIQFYGNGPQGWEYNAGESRWTHFTHPFSNDNYYFLKIDASDADGKRVPQAGDPGTAVATLDQVTGRHVKEFDEVMWSKDAGTGHTWVSTQIFPNQDLPVFSGTRLPGLAAGDVRYRARVAVRSNQSSPRTRVYFSADDAILGTVTAIPVHNSETSPIAQPAETQFLQTLTSAGAIDLTMTIEDRPDEPQAAIDWIRVFYPQDLVAQDGYLRFVTPPDQSGVLEFVLRGFSSTPVAWDVTRIDDIRALPVAQGSGDYRIRVNVAAGEPREIVAFTDQALRAPDAAVRIENQNLHGIGANPDFVIITPDTFRVYAEELAERRRTEGLIVEVADVAHVYNEFSGGLPDMRAVRDYFKFLYDRGAENDDRLQYALLFGDGHFNFRDLGSTASELENWIFPYETEESYDPIESYTSDDYFGLLDDHEGVWAYHVSAVDSLVERVDVGIGRFTVQTQSEARALLDKIERYESPATRGPWRSRYTFVADDGYNGLAGNIENTPDLHTQNIDVVADQVLADNPLLNQKKIYGISYPRVFLTQWRQPEVRRDLLASINSGTLIVNYSGHGGEDGLAQEQIFTREDAAALTNRDLQPIVVTATCSFGRWDLADDQSGAEVLHLNENGGAVALLTTVRLVFTSPQTDRYNVGLNLALNRFMMQYDDDGRPHRLGDVMRLTKNTREGLDTNNRKFNLIGDPTMRVGLPTPRVAIRAVNGQSLENEPVPVRALDRVTISGEVLTGAGSVDGSFSGDVHLTIYDAQRHITVEDASALRRGYYTVREDLIWRGEVQAQSGAFEATFVVPKDISYSNATGRISAYAMDEQVSGGGFTENIVVGGSSSNPPNDATGPSIALFMNDTTFVAGGLTNPIPELIVRLQDESGINTVGAGVGHELLLVVDGNEQRAANIGEFYQSEENSYQKGTIRFPMDVYLREQNRERLDPGPHTVEVRAWDVLNNSAAAALDFYVAQTEELALRNVLNYPNPLSRDTRFIFEHNKAPGTVARVQIRVYTLAGRPVRTLDHEQTLPGGVLPGGQVDVYWDGRDEDFDPVGTGVYLYKVRVEVEDGDETEVVERIEKLAVIR